MLNFQDPTSQRNITKPHVKSLLKDLMAEMRGFKYQITLQITFPKEMKNDETKSLFSVYFSSNAETVINVLDINDSLETSNKMA